MKLGYAHISDLVAFHHIIKLPTTTLFDLTLYLNSTLATVMTTNNSNIAGLRAQILGTYLPLMTQLVRNH
jgi:hypothetical protein